MSIFDLKINSSLKSITSFKYFSACSSQTLGEKKICIQLFLFPIPVSFTRAS